MTVLLGLLSIVFGSVVLGYIKYPWLLVVTALLFVVAILHLFQVLKPALYAESGTSPDAWICEDYFQGHESEEKNQRMLGFALAYRLIAQASVIDHSITSNGKRLILLNRALLIIQCSMIPMILSLVLEIL
jgi:hypothetical protein